METNLIIWAIEEEYDYFGYFVSELFMNKEDAEKRMKELKELNKGIDYKLEEWPVK